MKKEHKKENNKQMQQISLSNNEQDLQLQCTINGVCRAYSILYKKLRL